MAHKKAGGSSRNGRDSEGRRLGVKKFGGETIKTYQKHSNGTSRVAEAVKYLDYTHLL